MMICLLASPDGETFVCAVCVAPAPAACLQGPAAPIFIFLHPSFLSSERRLVFRKITSLTSSLHILPFYPRTPKRSLSLIKRT